MICTPGLYEKGEQILKNSCKTPECTITSRKSGWFPAFGGNKYEKNAEKRPTGQQTTCWPRLKWYVNPVMLGMLRIPRCRATEESSFPDSERCRATEESSFPDSERCAFLAAGDQGCFASWPPGKKQNHRSDEQAPLSGDFVFFQGSWFFTYYTLNRNRITSPSWTT